LSVKYIFKRFTESLKPPQHQRLISARIIQTQLGSEGRGSSAVGGRIEKRGYVVSNGDAINPTVG